MKQAGLLAPTLLTIAMLTIVDGAGIRLESSPLATPNCCAGR
jgi:hypothetical protein